MLEQELLVKAGPTRATEHQMDLLLCRVDLALEVRVGVVDHVPVFVAHIRLSQLLVFSDSL